MTLALLPRRRRSSRPRPSSWCRRALRTASPTPAEAAWPLTDPRPSSLWAPDPGRPAPPRRRTPRSCRQVSEAALYPATTGLRTNAHAWRRGVVSLDAAAETSAAGSALREF